MRFGWYVAVAAGLALGCNGDKDTTTGDTAPTDTGPTEVVDLLPQTVVEAVDILFVLDATWADGLAALDENVLDHGFETLLLADPNWRVAMIDPAAAGNSFGVLGPKFETWPFPQDPFGLPTHAGESKVRQAIYTALELRKELEQNSTFLRGDSDLYVIVFTDGKDATDDVSDGISQRDFAQWLQALKPDNQVRLGAITTPERAEYWGNHTVGDGLVFEVGSFRRALEEQFREAIDQKVTFQLNYTPTEPPATADVIYRNHRTVYELEQDYTYDDLTNTITFIDVVPRVESVVRVIYETEDAVSGGETTTTSSSTTTEETTTTGE
ncbi:MAG: hypothetical protein R3F59_06790 [Myxococcota bacterium]